MDKAPFIDGWWKIIKVKTKNDKKNARNIRMSQIKNKNADEWDELNEK